MISQTTRAHALFFGGGNWYGTGAQHRRLQATSEQQPPLLKAGLEKKLAKLPAYPPTFGHR